MILLDTSAILCALQMENGSRRLRELIGEAKLVAVGAPMLLESGMVMSQRRIDGRHAVEGFLRDCDADILEFRREHAEVAMSAFLRFGKGRHPAALNFGDCISYAFARTSGLRLIYTGNDFGQTDLTHLERLDVGETNGNS
jgi:ribonuclease VapC